MSPSHSSTLIGAGPLSRSPIAIQKFTRARSENRSTLRAMADQDHFPLFPIGMVALPHEAVPLHIFEERYKSLVAHCLEHEVEFGIIWAQDGELHEVGCAVMIETVLDRTADGRMDILCRGTRPFELINPHTEHAFPTGEVNFPIDIAPDEGAAGDQAEVQEARRLYAELVKEATDKVLDDEDLAEMNAYAMAATVEFGTEAKQALLELRDEDARLELLAQIFRAALKRVDEVGRAETLARSNGKVRFGSSAD